MDIRAVFKAYDDEYLKFERVEEKISERPDLHAFMLLDRLLAGKGDMVCCAEHDEIWLDVDVDELAKLATKGQIIQLIRCGVRYDEDTNSLAMFV